MPEEVPENYRIKRDFISDIERWVSEHKRPNEACLPVGDSSYSPNQVLEELKSNSELGKRLAFEYDKKSEAIWKKGVNDNFKIFSKGIGAMVLGMVATFSLGYVNLPKENYSNHPVVLEHQSAVKTLSNLERRRDYLQDKIDLEYQPEEAKTHLERVFSEESDKISSLDKAIEIIERDITELEDTEEVKANKKSCEEAVKKLPYFTFGFLGIELGIIGVTVGLFNKNFKKMKKKIDELLS